MNWTVEKGRGPAPRFVIVDVASGEEVAVTYGQRGQERDAALIAKAPELLAELIYLVEQIHNSGSPVVTRRSVALIAKAKGEV
jgi:hypothetical protein